MYTFIHEMNLGAFILATVLSFNAIFKNAENFKLFFVGLLIA